LTKIETVTDIETDINERVCSFRVGKDVDYKSRLEEFAKTNEHIEGYSIQ
jgi:hypothetical protein